MDQRGMGLVDRDNLVFIVIWESLMKLEEITTAYNSKEV